MIRHPITKLFTQNFFTQNLERSTVGSPWNHKIFITKVNIHVIFNIFTKFRTTKFGAIWYFQKYNMLPSSLGWLLNMPNELPFYNSTPTSFLLLLCAGWPARHPWTVASISTFRRDVAVQSPASCTTVKTSAHHLVWSARNEIEQGIDMSIMALELIYYSPSATRQKHWEWWMDHHALSPEAGEQSEVNTQSNVIPISSKKFHAC